DGVAVAAQLDHVRLELLDFGRVRAEERVVVDSVEIDGLELDRAERREIALDLEAQLLAQIFAGDRTGGDAHCGLTRGRAAAAAIITNPVFLVIRVVGVPGPETVLDLVIVASPLIDILDQQTDRGAGRHTLEDARKNLHGVRLAALRDEAGLAGAAAVQIFLNVLLGQREPGRAAVDDAAERRPVAFAEGRDGKELPERVAGHA